MNYSDIFKGLPEDVKEIFVQNSIGKGLVGSNGERLTVKDVEEMNIIPRCQKPKEVQKERTKKKAEVFTPVWVVNEQNNLIDNAYLGKDNVFSTEGKDFKCKEIDWKGCFGSKDTYIKSRRLEITCGEAPYITTRYSTSTGEAMAFAERVGFLDRKLKVALTMHDLSLHGKWCCLFDSVQNCYGYEYQADSLIIARLNIWLSCFDYCNEASIELSLSDSAMLAKIISKNFFQLDGLKNCEPFTEEEVYIKDWSKDIIYKWTEMFKEGK